MSHHKNRKPKPFKGCCGMCACRTLDCGVRTKRRRSMQERRAGYRERGGWSQARELDA